MDNYKAKLDKLQAALKDPAVVHVMILRGDISLTKEQAIHIAGLDADIDKTMAELRDHNSQNIESSETAHRAFDIVKVKLDETLRIAARYRVDHEGFGDCCLDSGNEYRCSICRTYDALVSPPAAKETK